MIATSTPKLLQKKFTFLSIQYKNEWKELYFLRQKQKKQKSEFNNNKKVIKIDDIDVNKILVSKG